MRIQKNVLWLSIVMTAALMLSGAAASGAEVKTASGDDDSAPAALERVPQLPPGGWSPIFEMGENLFPSYLIATANMKDDEDGDDQENDDPFRMGDSWGTVGVAIRAPVDNCQVKIRISGTDLIKTSVFTVTLPQNDCVYRIFPPLKYDDAGLASHRATTVEKLTFKVTINGKTGPEIVKSLEIRPVTECVYAYTDCMGVPHDQPWMLAAYVDENQPLADAIIQDALKSGRIDCLAGYQKDDIGVLAEVEAIWETMAHRRYRFDAIPKGFPEDTDFGRLELPLPGGKQDLTKSNGSVGCLLLAAALRKAGLDVSLVLMPEHMMVAVDLDEFGDETVYLDVGMMGQYTFPEAVKEGQSRFDDNTAHFESDRRDDWNYQLINLAEARQQGVNPLPNPAPAK